MNPWAQECQMFHRTYNLFTPRPSTPFQANSTSNHLLSLDSLLRDLLCQDPASDFLNYPSLKHLSASTPASDAPDPHLLPFASEYLPTFHAASPGTHQTPEVVSHMRQEGIHSGRFISWWDFWNPSSRNIQANTLSWLDQALLTEWSISRHMLDPVFSQWGTQWIYLQRMPRRLTCMSLCKPVIAVKC